MQFSKELSVGNRIIDSEHKKLYDLIDGITPLIAARSIAALSEAFELLESCLRAYFAVEENIAQAVNFDFNQHRVAHQDLFIKFQRVKDELKSKNCVLSKSEKEFHIGTLKSYLVQHIKVHGKPFKIVLGTQF